MRKKRFQKNKMMPPHYKKKEYAPEQVKSLGLTEMNPRIFRPGTKHDKIIINFFLAQGGLGDYICHMPAFEYIAEQNPQVKGRIFSNPPFVDVAKHIMKRYPDWEVYQSKEAEKIISNGEMIINPALFQKYISACGAHLMDLGFMYYCNLHKPPKEYNRMTDLTGQFNHSFSLPEKYAVVTPGATSKARTMTAQGFNSICDYLNSIGITPVFLGKKDFAYMGKESDYYAEINQDYDLSKGVNLLEQTTLFEAVAVMEKAQLVVGLDNGLLHFAGCTKTPIVFGHSVTSVEDREIRRLKGKVVNISVDSTLPCSGCQSKMRFIIGHRFKYCIYGDYACLDLLFKDEAKIWKEAIDVALT